MLIINNLFKSYKYGRKKIDVLKNVNLNFKSKELVFILGKSGSGKSTLLNIIGGILKPSDGTLYLDDECVSKYSEKRMNKYRSNTVSFIFQDYQLIEYMSVYDNVKLSLNKVDKNIMDTLLKQLNIYDKRNVKVNKLSGGEKQRVAIARALLKDPEILLCDEPTGALDNGNGIKIMELLKMISKNKLVIVVSHDLELARKYADRIINIEDGEIKAELLDDKNLFTIDNKNEINKTTTIKLAIKNLLLNKKRTFLISLAISIGLISLLLVTSLSVGFSREIKELENRIIGFFPITIRNASYELDNANNKISDNKILIKKNENYVHVNKISNEYIKYLNNISEIKYITFNYDIMLPIVTDNYKLFNSNNLLPVDSANQVFDNYKILAGRNIVSLYEVLLKVDSNNNVSSSFFEMFGIDSDIEYNDIIGRKIKIILNNDYYVKDNKYYFAGNDFEKMYLNSSIELKIVGVVREKEVTDDNNYLIYDNELLEIVNRENSKSNIVKEQFIKKYNVLGNNLSIEDNLSYLGYDAIPNRIDIYVDNIKSKNRVIKLLDLYNQNHSELIYEDGMSDAIGIVQDFINIITLLLIVFAFISLIVSMIMICIITNTRVLERVKEIGILRSIGASKSNIRMLFCTENIIISIISFVMSYLVIFLLRNPINIFINSFIGSDTVFKIELNLLMFVLGFNILITLFAGLVPSVKASKLEIVDCIRRGY